MKQTTLARLSVSVSLAGAALSAAAAMPADESFENQPLAGYAHVLDNWVLGQWGAENGSITGPVSGMFPAHGSRMLGMRDDGLNWTQTVQIVDVSAYSALIDGGGAVANFRALFNYAGAGGAESLSGLWSFGQNDRWGSHTAVLFNTMAIDGSTSTWEHNQVSMALPVGTRWLITEVGYVNASIGTETAYADSAYLEVVPEPATLVALGAGLACLLRRRAKR